LKNVYPGGIGCSLAPRAEHAACRFYKLGDHVEVEDDGRVEAGAVGKALDFVVEVLQGEGDDEICIEFNW
jgi:hypothetical protein